MEDRGQKSEVMGLVIALRAYFSYSTFSTEGSRRTCCLAVGSDPQGRKRLPACGQHLAGWEKELSDNIVRHIQKYPILLECKSKNIH